MSYFNEIPTIRISYQKSRHTSHNASWHAFVRSDPSCILHHKYIHKYIQKHRVMICIHEIQYNAYIIYCHEVGWVCPITSLHLQHVTNLYISMFFIRYHSKVGLWNVLRDFPIAMEIPSKHQVRLNDFNSVTSYLWLNWMCRVLIGHS